MRLDPFDVSKWKSKLFFLLLKSHLARVHSWFCRTCYWLIRTWLNPSFSVFWIRSMILLKQQNSTRSKKKKFFSPQTISEKIFLYRCQIGKKIFFWCHESHWIFWVPTRFIIWCFPFVSLWVKLQRNLWCMFLESWGWAEEGHFEKSISILFRFCYTEEALPVIKSCQRGREQQEETLSPN